MSFFKLFFAFGIKPLPVYGGNLYTRGAPPLNFFFLFPYFGPIGASFFFSSGGGPPGPPHLEGGGGGANLNPHFLKRRGPIAPIPNLNWLVFFKGGHKWGTLFYFPFRGNGFCPSFGFGACWDGANAKKKKTWAFGPILKDSYIFFPNFFIILAGIVKGFF